MLIVDDEKHTREGLAQLFSDNFEVYTASQPSEAFNLMDSERFDVIITDLRMGQQSGISIIDKALQLPYKPKCIMMTAYGSIEIAVEAMKHGAFDFVSKPVQLERLECIVKRAMSDKENVPLIATKANAIPMIGKSEGFAAVMDKIQRVAPAKTSVLITGETGTGKELVAHQLHNLSPRNTQPFVPVHCAALPDNLIESELFGHERGAFTGALQRHIGLFESANHGTLFLDEIGEIDASTQVKLLRFLETKSIERLGGNQLIPLDVRLVCATNRDLQSEVNAGRFREDLLYRLNVVEIHIPPLRERPSDVRLLLDYYFRLFAKENNVPLPILSEEIKTILQNYIWPGNIRELRNFSENMVVMHSGKVLTVSDLDPKFLAPISPKNASTTLEQSEQDLITETLKKVHGNKSEAARLLGIPRRSFYRKLERLQ
jgi:two-component system, NtrC family, response regulator AtoC